MGELAVVCGVVEAVCGGFDRMDSDGSARETEAGEFLHSSRIMVLHRMRFAFACIPLQVFLVAC